MFELLQYLMPNLKFDIYSLSCEVAISIFYMYNYFVLLEAFWNNDIFWLIYALTPLFILALLKGFELRRMRYGKVWVLILALVSVPVAIFFADYGLPSILLLFISYFIFWIYIKGAYGEKLKYLFITAILFFLLNFWVLPIFSSFLNYNLTDYSVANNGFLYTIEGIKYWSIGLMAYIPIFEVPVGQPLNWYYYYNHFIPFFLLFIIGIQLIPLFTKPLRENKRYISLLILLLFFETAVAGVNGPFEFLYYFLLSRKLTIMAGLQNLLLVFGYPVIVLFCIVLAEIVSSTDILISKLTKRSGHFAPHFDLNKSLIKNGRKFLLLLIVVILLISESYSWAPNVVPQEAGISSITNFPNYYEKLAIYVENNIGNHLILGLPVGAALEGLNNTNGTGGFIGDSPLKEWSGAPSLMEGQVPQTDCYLYYNIIYPMVTYSTNVDKFAKLLWDLPFH